MCGCGMCWGYIRDVLSVGGYSVFRKDVICVGYVREEFVWGVWMWGGGYVGGGYVVCGCSLCVG